MRTPVTLVTGVDPVAMGMLTVGLQWELPDAVVCRHRIDVERQVLERVVSDITGVLDRTEIDLEHACVTCAIREDVIPTLRRLARDGRWRAVVAHQPVGAEAEQVCTVLALDVAAARDVRVSAVLTAVDGSRVVDDVLGDELLHERNAHTSAEDRRGVGEVLAAMVEHADVVVLTEPSTTRLEVDLLRTLARPGALLLEETVELSAAMLLDGRLHDHDAARAWAGPDVRRPLPARLACDVWRVDLRSDRPFHPERLLHGIGGLGSGPHRSRGCFWLPTRPGLLCEWDGAGGQLSIGSGGRWRLGRPHTRLVLTGVGGVPDHLEDTFDDLLMTPAELRGRGPHREASYDGLEAWLGPVRRIA